MLMADISIGVMKVIITSVSDVHSPQLFSNTMASVDSLASAVGSMYVREFFKEEAKSAADAMVVFIRRQFEKMLQTQDWMDPFTRIRALAKAKAITPRVAYPPEALMDDKLAEKYDGVSQHLLQETKPQYGADDIGSGKKCDVISQTELLGYKF